MLVTVEGYFFVWSCVPQQFKTSGFIEEEKHDDKEVKK